MFSSLWTYALGIAAASLSVYWLQLVGTCQGYLLSLAVAMVVYSWVGCRARGNEAQRLLDGFPLPYRPREKRLEDMTLGDVRARLVDIRGDRVRALSDLSATSSAWKRLVAKVHR